MSAHRPMGLTGETTGQWLDAMARAIEDTRIDPTVAVSVRQAFARMAGAMSSSGP